MVHRTRIYIVGLSGSGKTFLVNHLRTHSDLKTSIAIAPRYVTREPRPDEPRDGENIFLSDEQFRELVDAGHIVEAWPKLFESGRRIWYGFPRVADRKPVIVYPANMEFLQHTWKWDIEAGDRAFVVQIEAPLQCRRDRIERRGVGMTDDEWAVRLNGPAESSVKSFADILLRNDSTHEQTAGHFSSSAVERLFECLAHALFQRQLRSADIGRILSLLRPPAYSSISSRKCGTLSFQFG